MEGINWSAMKFGLDLVSTIGCILLFIWTMIQRRQKDNSKDIGQLVQRHQDLDKRVQKLENSQALLATHEDVSRIKSELSRLREKTESMNHILSLLHDHLLNNKGD